MAIFVEEILEKQYKPRTFYWPAKDSLFDQQREIDVVLEILDAYRDCVMIGHG